MHEVCAVCNDDFGLEHSFSNAFGGIAGAGTDRAYGWRVGVVVVVLMLLAISAHFRVGGRWRVHESCLELLETSTIRFQLLTDLDRVVVPIAWIAEPKTKSRMIAGVVEICDFAHDGHQGQEVAENGVASTFK